jgi:predicted acetyltransferase
LRFDQAPYEGGASHHPTLSAMELSKYMNANIQLKQPPKAKPKEKYWHIHAGKLRAGHIAIKESHSDELGDHYSVDIHINQRMRGKGIGKAAYKQASIKSGYPVIYAHMRKSNVASQKAAEAAGYKVIEVPGDNQLTMKWEAEA